MKKKFAYLGLSLSLFMSVIAVPVTSYSLEETVEESEQTTTTSTTTTVNRNARIETYKKSLKETVTAAAKLRIAERCVASQAKIKGRSSSNSAAGAAHTTNYNRIVTKLESLSATVAAKDVDVTTLDANIAELKVKIAVFSAADTTYRQALADLSALDCKTDPTAFKAALETARTDQAEVLAASKAIRTYLKDTVKPTLSAIKTALKSEDN